MNPNLKTDEWKIIEEVFDPQFNRDSESLFSIGNGHLGQRATFEEKYSGDSMQGSYVAGVYYPDKTRVGWWKNGYPEYFAKVLNSPNWIGINITVGNEQFDLADCKVESFRRVLDMKSGILEREFVCLLKSGVRISVKTRRFVSMADYETGAIEYSITPLNNDVNIITEPYIDGDVVNEDSNYDEIFWKNISADINNEKAVLVSATRKTNFHVAVAMKSILLINDQEINPEHKITRNDKYISRIYSTDIKKGSKLTIYKYASVLSSENNPRNRIAELAVDKVNRSSSAGFESLLKDHKQKWSDKWDECDIIIDGDPSAQQSVRFNIFHLYQTYTGTDHRLNIGPKGFTGEKYGGSTYWDTEAFVLSFYLNTADSGVARNLLLYRYNHLEKAIENAEKLGFKDGAAFYPMVTMNGEECHNEWEITFEEIHRNGAIAFAIYRYINHTADEDYLVDFGLEVLIAISRFWSQRVNFSTVKNSYVILGVTGPNEYENNVNNNWYTNTMATWTLQYTLESLERVEAISKDKFRSVTEKVSFDSAETEKWRDIVANMYYPVDDESGIFLQQEGYLDKEQVTTDTIDPAELPINQHWSWDRILRSCFIKQADVLQGIYNFEERYDIEMIRRNFDFYEPRTVHESSLSPGIYSIIAATIGNMDKAYELYLRAARLDLDDYNKEAKEGLHLTSMAGTWLSIVEGFGGMRIKKERIILKPLLPDKWKSYSFYFRFHNNIVKVTADNDGATVTNLSQNIVPVEVYGICEDIDPGKKKKFGRKK
ncbi:MAG: glycoside hydrolase family 65 protein [Bacteroidales bacterium]|nr:glycoside hydrolase family 65 protein [Bacteroidales bacterium]